MNQRSASGKVCVEKNVPQRKDIGSKIYVLTCPISSYVRMNIAAMKPISANTAQFKTSTSRKSGVTAKCAPKRYASTKMIAEEISPRSTAASTLPITKAGGQIGAMIYSSMLL